MRTLLLLGAAALLANAQTKPLVFTHVTVIDATGAPAAADQTVIVWNGRIFDVGPARSVRVPSGAILIEARGKYLIPGLWDMHVHFRGGPDSIPDNEASLTVYLANGITGVREMGGDIVDTTLRWRQEIAEGKRLGPRIVTAGPKLDGLRPAWPGSIPVGDEEAGRRAVRAVKNMGADFVKLYFSRVDPKIYSAIMDEARKQQLSVTGHVALNDLRVRDVVEAGQHIEHLNTSMLPGCSRAEAEVAEERRAIPQPQPPAQNQGQNQGQNPAAQQRQLALQTKILDGFDPVVARDLFALMAKKGTWVDPTLAVQKLIASMDTTDYSNDPRRKYVFPVIWKSWDPAAGRRRPYSDAQRHNMDRAFEIDRTILPMMRDAGVGLIAGSDSGASNNFTFPGFTLHEELAMLVDAGLKPMDVLQMATRNPARYFGELSDHGTIEKDKLANLDLLDANPLEDIRNTSKINAVVVRGKLLMRADLDQMLKTVAEQAAAAREKAAMPSGTAK